MTVALISPQDITPGQALNGRIIVSIEFDEAFDIFTVYFAGRGSPVELALGDRLILHPELHDGRDYLVRHTVPEPVTRQMERDHGRALERIERGELRARRAGKISDEDLSDDAILKMLGGARNRISKNVDAFEARTGKRLI